jgi:hypothetical protein
MVLLRGTTLIFTVLGLLVCASIVIGQIMDTVILVGKFEVEGSVYTLYVEDQVHEFRITLEGTNCFPALADWFRPGASPSQYLYAILRGTRQPLVAGVAPMSSAHAN